MKPTLTTLEDFVLELSQNENFENTIKNDKGFLEY